MSETKEFTLSRTGQAPLRFQGQLLADVSSRSHQGPLQNRWHEIQVHKTTKGKLIAAVGFRTIWQGERDGDTVFVCGDEKCLIDDLTNSYQPSEGWTGHPPGVREGERKNALLHEAIVGGYRALVSEILDDLGIVETVE